jgi:hypothetical protein
MFISHMKKKVTRRVSHANTPGVKRDHNTLFLFWVLAAILLVIVVALLRAA